MWPGSGQQREGGRRLGCGPRLAHVAGWAGRLGSLPPEREQRRLVRQPVAAPATGGEEGRPWRRGGGPAGSGGSGQIPSIAGGGYVGEVGRRHMGAPDGGLPMAAAPACREREREVW